MERLTERNETGRAIFSGNDTPIGNTLRLGDILETLAKYEETGLTPEQVTAMKTELQDERYRHDRQADFTVGQSKVMDELRSENAHLKQLLELARGERDAVTKRMIELEATDTPKIYRAALDTFGAEAQTKMLFEEIGELMAAICQYSRGRDKVAHVAEEIADVRIMLNQMAVLFGCEDEVERQRRYKLRRLEQRIEEKNRE